MTLPQRTLCAVLVLGLLGLGIAGCASGGATTTASPSASWDVAYENPALGVSFRHPESWRTVRTVDPDEAPTRDGDVEMHGPEAVVLDVGSTEEDVPEPPFRAHAQLAYDRELARSLGFHVVGQDVVTVAGQPFARTDVLFKGQHAVTLTGLASGMLVSIDFHCPKRSWPAQSKVLDAVLSSMRFTAPGQSSREGA